jgi:hypothetical protein
MTEANGSGDQQVLAVLDKVKLERFTATPEGLSPFESGVIEWQVSVPDSDIAVSILLDGAEVAVAGALPIAPELTTTYRLSADARNHRKQLGQLTVDVDLSACITKDDPQIIKWVAGGIKTKVAERTDGVYLRPGLFGIDNPIVRISEGRMYIHLVLGKNVKGFPDPTITIDASFGLEVVPGPPPASVRPVLVSRPDVITIPPVIRAAGKEISTDVSFPYYAWLIPGAMLILPIIESQAEGDAYRSGDSMVDDLASQVIGTHFATPLHTYKQHAAFTDDWGGDLVVTFCPESRPEKE